jgi:type IV pilus assembly protein PilY1
MNMIKSLLVSFAAAVLSLGAPLAQAQVQAIPPNILATNNLPMVMLSASKDFTMFWRAYTDFDDINNDGIVDRTFMPDYKYYGYFDATKCYKYIAANTRFEPSRIADTAGGTYYCTSGAGEWSGNFLNWSTMSRIDVLRRVLYGGKRYTDSTTDSSLEMSFVPRNSQAIVKYYNGADLDKLTPYHSAAAKAAGITLCRREHEDGGVSQVNTFTPEIRVAVGNVILWNMTEIRTCNWSGEEGYAWQAPTIDFLNKNYQTPDGTLGKDVPAHQHLTSVPPLSGENSAYVARVQVCVASLLGNEHCKNYSPPAATANYKPIGLLHEFGESSNSGVVPARAEFGLMLGSYDHNLSSGVLRKALGQMNDEINPTTGQIVTPAAGGGGIITALNRITLYGYDAGGGSYQENCFSNNISDGHCPSWGNPVSELLLESLRYYAGKSLVYPSNGGYDNSVGLPYVTSPGDPLKANPAIGASTRAKLYGQPICRPLTMLTITSGSSSYDEDLSRFTDIGPAHATAAAITKILGDQEGVTGTTRLVGENSTDHNQLCTGKTIDDLGAVRGICADGPNFKGTYLGAGVAYYANTNKIRSDLTVIPPDLSPTALMVRQYGVSMSGGVATLAIPVDATHNVYITPASMDWNSGGAPLPGNLVDFKILSRSADGQSGAALALWQHAMLGEDQDLDQLQALRWTVSGTTLKIYTQAIEANTGSGAPYATGYTVVGTTNDGVHLHSGINDYVTSETGLDVSNALYAGSNEGQQGRDCVLDVTTPYPRSLCVVYNGTYYRGETGQTYTITGATNALIREPLWYMSKYGGFKYDGNPANQYPTAANTPIWDTKRADGKACGGAGLPCSDGEPDNYFVARNPDLLESSLREIFETIVNASNNAPAVASSQLNAGDIKYVASFTPGDGHGELSGFAIDNTTGAFQTVATWFAHTQLTATLPNDRQIITNSGGTGTAFRWSTLSTAEQNDLIGGADITTGQQMLQWLRGDTTVNSLFRTRASSSVLGPIVNSNPVVQGPPNGKFFGTAFSGYPAFITAYAARKSIVWVGAGDGMLHGFDANPDVAAGGSSPVLSYVPEPLFSRLPDWAYTAQPAVQAFVDGSPFIGDVKISSSWSTYLFASLGRGGKGMFALDVTNPAALNETNAASVFKWQFTTADDASGDLGYVVSEPTTSRFTNQSGQIAPMNNGKFAALFGNGVQSANGSAALYILFADGPSGGAWTGRYVKIVADIGPNNSLSQPIWVDTDGDGIADAIYAGDIKGNLWKFDVSSTDSTQWKVAFTGLPLYTAQDSNGNPLPLSNAVEARPHPLGGMILDFATGKALVSGDYPNVTTRVDGIYGIWDKPSFATGNAASLPGLLPRTLSQLGARTFNSTPTGDRYVTGDAIDWTNTLGWYLPYPVSSEMSVGNLAIAASQLAAISIAPIQKAHAADPDPCNIKPAARLNILDPVSGLAGDLLPSTTITLADGTVVTVFLATVDIADQKLRLSRDDIGKAVGPGIGDPSCQAGTADCYRFIGKDTDLSLKSSVASRRIFWREIPGLKTLN